MALINLGAYYANKAALDKAGYGGPAPVEIAPQYMTDPVVEDLGNVAPPNSPAAAEAAAVTANKMGLPAAPPQMGMIDHPTMPWEQPAPKLPGGGFVVEAPPEASAIVAAANPANQPAPPPAAPPTNWKAAPTYTQSDEDLLAGLQKESAAAKLAGKDTSAIDERIHNLMLHRESAPLADGVQPKIGASAPKSGGHGGGGSFGGGSAHHAPTLADKKKALLLPGQEAAFENEKEFMTSQEVSNDMIRDEQVDAELKVNAMHAEALSNEEQQLAQEKAKREEFDAYYSGEQNKLQAESDKIANTSMDPARLFKGDKGWLAVTSAIAASIFGVFGAPATGGKNLGVEAVNKAIDRDLMLQDADLKNAKEGVGRKSSLLAQKYAVFGDKSRAMAAARIDAWKLAMAKADSYAAQSGQKVHVLQAAKVREAGEREIERAQENFDIGVEAGWKQKELAEAAARARAAAAAQAKVDKYTDMAMKLEGTGAEQVLKDFPGAKVVFDGNHIVVTDPTTGKRLWAGDGGGPSSKAPTVTVPGDMNAKGEWGSAGVAVAHSPEASNKYMALTEAAKKGKAVIAKMRALRDKMGGGEWMPSSEEKADALKYGRELFKADKTVGENSDKDAERIQATIPDVFEKDFRAFIMGGKAFPDALIDQWDQQFDGDIARANSVYLKKPPTNPVPVTVLPKGK